jgi:hypothetical protein
MTCLKILYGRECLGSGARREFHKLSAVSMRSVPHGALIQIKRVFPAPVRLTLPFRSRDAGNGADQEEITHAGAGV